MGLSVVLCIQLAASIEQNRLLYSHIRNRPAGETILRTSDGGDGNRFSTRPLGNSLAEMQILPAHSHPLMAHHREAVGRGER